ncbi:hypothetical protein F4860DRAFT_495003 [Xylaria cubensis]|nr:hypothetical protein F4860DRAFT_495003 [Xylaria cubensis]
MFAYASTTNCIRFGENYDTLGKKERSKLIPCLFIYPLILFYFSLPSLVLCVYVYYLMMLLNIVILLKPCSIRILYAMKSIL